MGRRTDGVTDGFSSERAGPLIRRGDVSRGCDIGMAAQSTVRRVELKLRILG